MIHSGSALYNATLRLTFKSSSSQRKTEKMEKRSETTTCTVIILLLRRGDMQGPKPGQMFVTHCHANYSGELRSKSKRTQLTLKLNGVKMTMIVLFERIPYPAISSHVRVQFPWNVKCWQLDDYFTSFKRALRNGRPEICSLLFFLLPVWSSRVSINW